MQQILKSFVRNATSAMFQNKKLKHNTTSANEEVEEVTRCTSNCAMPTLATFVQMHGCSTSDFDYNCVCYLLKRFDNLENNAI